MPNNSDVGLKCAKDCQLLYRRYGFVPGKSHHVLSCLVNFPALASTYSLRTLKGGLHPGTLAPRIPGTLDPWHPGTLAPRYPITLAPFHPGTLAPWQPGSRAAWDPETLALWHPGILATWQPGPGTLTPRHPGTLAHQSFSIVF